MNVALTPSRRATSRTPYFSRMPASAASSASELARLTSNWPGPYSTFATLELDEVAQPVQDRRGGRIEVVRLLQRVAVDAGGGGRAVLVQQVQLDLEPHPDVVAEAGDALDGAAQHGARRLRQQLAVVVDDVGDDVPGLGPPRQPPVGRGIGTQERVGVAAVRPGQAGAVVDVADVVPRQRRAAERDPRPARDPVGGDALAAHVPLVVGERHLHLGEIAGGKCSAERRCQLPVSCRRPSSSLHRKRRPPPSAWSGASLSVRFRR